MTGNVGTNAPRTEEGRSLVTRNSDELRALRGRMRSAALKGDTVESAAQAVTDVLYEECSETVVLARIFLSRPLERLPDDCQLFARTLAESKGARGLTPATPVLALLGTRGAAPEWNDRKRSSGHVAIPLLPDLVRGLPMISGLMTSLGIDLSRVDSRLVVAAPTAAVFSGMFRVPDARTGIDKAARKLVPAQDFVERHAVRTVFGIGGLYLSVDSMLAMLVFCRQSVEEGTVRQLMPFASNFAAITSAMIMKGDVFRP